jgi:hypothetical protein
MRRQKTGRSSRTRSVSTASHGFGFNTFPIVALTVRMTTWKEVVSIPATLQVPLSN